MLYTIDTERVHAEDVLERELPKLRRALLVDRCQGMCHVSHSEPIHIVEYEYIGFEKGWMHRFSSSWYNSGYINQISSPATHMAIHRLRPL